MNKFASYRCVIANVLGTDTKTIVFETEQTAALAKDPKYYQTNIWEV